LNLYEMSKTLKNPTLKPHSFTHSTKEDLFGSSFSSDSSLLACCTSQGKIHIYFVDTLESFKLISVSTSSLYTLVWGANDEYIYTAGSDGFIYIVDIKDGTSKQWQAHTTTLRTMAIDLKGVYLITGSYDKSIMIFRVTSEKNKSPQLYLPIEICHQKKLDLLNQTSPYQMAMQP